MGRRTEYIFFQRGNTDGQQAHEKMLNIANNQGNANQNHNEASLHTYQNGSLKRTQTTNVGKDVEKRQPLYTVGGNVNWCSHCGKQYGSFLKN